jgi:hypothetical protein
VHSIDLLALTDSRHSIFAHWNNHHYSIRFVFKNLSFLLFPSQPLHCVCCVWITDLNLTASVKVFITKFGNWKECWKSCKLVKAKVKEDECRRTVRSILSNIWLWLREKIWFVQRTHESKSESRRLTFCRIFHASMMTLTFGHHPTFCFVTLSNICTVHIKQV